MNASEGRSRMFEPDPVAVAVWLELDRLATENCDLRSRIDRTLGYVDEISAASLDTTVRLVVDAVRRSLVTPTTGVVGSQS